MVRSMNEEELMSYLIPYCKKELSGEELLKLEQWLEEKEEHRQTFDRMVAVYKQGRRVGIWKAVNEKQAWVRISGQLASSRKPIRKLGWLKYAAIVFILFGAGLMYTILQNLEQNQELSVAQILPGRQKAILMLSDGREIALNNDTTCVFTEENGARITLGGQERIVYQAGNQESEKLVYNTIRVPRGGEYSLVLSDGTRVWLNAETELTYPAVFGAGERKLVLKGEACFDVVRDTTRPFIVESTYNRVEVLGTRFNVSAYASMSSVKTTLLRGSVRVSNGQDQLILIPGQQAICHGNGIEKCEVDAQAVTAWVNGTFEFENMSLGEITDQLGRWYDIDFLFMKPGLREITFTGAATRYRELGFLLQMLEQLADVRFQIENKVIKVSEK